MTNEPTVPQPIHDSVSKAYAEALRRTQQTASGGCGCGPACCASVVETAGYSHELDAFAEAGASSFGCGNPLAFADVQPGQTVLDLGSGAGLDLLVAAQKVGPTGKVIGVDMTDAMIEAARQNAERAGAHQIVVRKGLIEALPVEDASVDHVISNCVINLSPEKHKVFAEIARVLKPGGQFRISDIVAETMPDVVKHHAAAYAACIAGAISEKRYLVGLHRVGMEDVQVASRIDYTADQIRAMVMNDFELFGADGTDLVEAFAGMAGKVASITVTGRKPLERKGSCCSGGGSCC
jgi:SAM-dependent methyltransferase